MLHRLKSAVYRTVAVGQNVRVGRGFHVGPGSRLWAPTGLAVGDDVYIGKWCTIEADGSIGSGVLIANNVGIVGKRDHDMRQVGAFISRARWVGDPECADLRSEFHIGPDVWIGFGAVVLAPVSIGRGAVVAAGSVVVGDVEPYSIVAGNPARPVGRRFDDEDSRRQDRLLHGHGRVSQR